MIFYPHKHTHKTKAEQKNNVRMPSNAENNGFHQTKPNQANYLFWTSWSSVRIVYRIWVPGIDVLQLPKDAGLESVLSLLLRERKKKKEEEKKEIPENVENNSGGIMDKNEMLPFSLSKKKNKKKIKWKVLMTVMRSEMLSKHRDEGLGCHGDEWKLKLNQPQIWAKICGQQILGLALIHHHSLSVLQGPVVMT